MTGLLGAADLARTALLVVDVQRGFDDSAYWGRRDNPACEDNITALLAAWRADGRPVVLARHDSTDERSPLHPSRPGNSFKPVITGGADLLVTKHVNSCFHGTPDLDAWLRGRGLTGLAIAGISTNHCCETTARLAGNLGYEVLFVLDATHSFDRRGPDGSLIRAEELARVTAANLHGEFARVVTTRELVMAGDAAEQPGPRPSSSEPSERYSSEAIPDPGCFAETWIAAWNARKLEEILAHYDDEVVFTSPTAVRFAPGSEGTVHGKDALRRYWTAALKHNADLRFTLADVHAGINTLVIRYHNQAGATVAEVLTFRDGLIAAGHATHLR